MAIPKIIWTTWLSLKEGCPPLIEKCLNSHKLEGYEHRIITLENCFRNTYVDGCIKNKRWAKAADYLRMQALFNYGGIYLDADMEVLEGKNFDKFLHHQMFIHRECAGLFANMGLGAEVGHPVIGEYLRIVNENFVGTGDLVFQTGIQAWHDLIWNTNLDAYGIKLYPVDYFCPYNHLNGQVNITENSVVYHHFYKSWTEPKVSIIIPTLKRPEGLQRCLNSIKKLNYPQHLIEVLVQEDEPRIGVPRRVKELYEKSTGDLIVYASNDTEFTPDSLKHAVNQSKEKGLVAFNTGLVYPDEGNICEHFLIRRDIVEKLGEIFDTDFGHYGCDNLLWAKCKKLGEASRCEDAILVHHHFTKGNAIDDINRIAFSTADKDRELLKEKLGLMV